MAQQVTTPGEERVERISSQFREPSWLKTFRLGALKCYSELPDEQSNLYSKYALDVKVDLSALEREQKVDPLATPIHEIAEGIDPKGTYYVSTQSETIASKSVKSLEEQDVIFCDMHEALEKHEGILKKIFENKAIKPESDKYAALNSALFSSGWLVYVPKGVHVKSPLRIRSYLGSKRPSFSQTWIYAEPESSVSLQTESYGAEIETVASEIVEAYVRDYASVHYSNIENYSQHTTVLANKKALCEREAIITWTLGYFGGLATRGRVESVFEGDGASSEDVEVVFGNGAQKFDLVSDLTHIARHTKGRILANSVVNDKSVSIFKGMIRIGKQAKNASAFLAGHSILLSQDAKSDAIPGLEILCNDVKATHSASVAQIDDDQIFYMMTRGLPLDEAKKFIVLGFLEPAISRIDSEDLRDTMRDLVEAKWYGKTGLVKMRKKEVLFEEEGEQPKTSKDIFEGHYKYR
ncbi:MAG: SufB/SufD family protein [Nitrososphaerales archaeon]